MKRNFLLVMTITACGLILSCSKDEIDTESSPPCLQQECYDGVWTWYENDVALYNVTLEEGKIVHMSPVARSAKKVKYAKSDTTYDPDQGLRMLNFWGDRDAQNGRMRHRFVFESPQDANEDVLVGKRIVKYYAPDDDDAPTPPGHWAGGELRRQK